MSIDDYQQIIKETAYTVAAIVIDNAIAAYERFGYDDGYVTDGKLSSQFIECLQGCIADAIEMTLHASSKASLDLVSHGLIRRGPQ